MVKSLGAALLAVAMCASTAGAVHDPDVTDLEFKCQSKGQSKAGVKFVSCKSKCVSKCIAGARKVPPLNPESDCFPPFGGATLDCVTDPVKGCEIKAVGAIEKACRVIDPTKTDCPECYSARGGGADCSGHALDVVVDGLSNPSAASLESQIDTFGFVFCNDGPNTAAEDKCQQSTAKTLVKFVGCKNKCYDKCEGAMHKGTIAVGSCSPPNPADAATNTCLFDSIKGCEAKAIAALDKACVTPPADAPECYSHTSSSIVALVETAIDGNIGTGSSGQGNYCGSPSGAFIAD